MSKLSELITKKNILDAEISSEIDSILTKYDEQMEAASISQLHKIYQNAFDEMQSIDPRLLDTPEWFMFSNYYAQLKEEKTSL